MGLRRRAAVAALIGSSAVGHIGYPAALWAVRRFGRQRPANSPPSPTTYPPVTVIVPAYLEAGVIAAKVANIEANGYPGELEVLVVADGDPDSEEKARAAGARTLLLEERTGKSQAINRGMEVASHEAVVITDANNNIEPGAIAELVRWLEDPRVGAVAGEKLEDESGSEGVYWRFEAWIKRREHELGSTIGLDGGLCAVRRSMWRPIPPDISNDDFWIALDLMERGLRVAYEPGALVREESIGAVELQWERRTRVLAGGLWVMWRKRRLLTPQARLVAFELLGHKAWRSTAGPLSQGALLVLAAAGARRSRVAQLFLLGHVAAAGSMVATMRGKRLPMPLRLGGQVLFFQAVALGGMLRFLRGDRVLRWPKPAR
jgi:poly-beta-1,6-N-acetyl-D-glucosamine synthase